MPDEHVLMSIVNSHSHKEYRTMIAVILIEPAVTQLGPPESELRVEDQVNEVFLFDREEDANAWIDMFQEGLKNIDQYRFMMMEPSDPKTVIKALSTNG